jgi:GTP-binding protein LepA
MNEESSLSIPLSRIRNFCIIAHIDHGKSTLADRMLQITETVAAREFRDQILDDMDLERERGITIKSHPVAMKYVLPSDGLEYLFNLIDTPGHVDFAYEVSRSMAACEGALLVVDAAQGVEAQTVANTHMAVERNLEIIPVINKIDLPNADPEETRRQIEDVLAVDASDNLRISAKTGAGIEPILEAVVRKIPPPAIDADCQTVQALVFDSMYDTYRGVIVYVRMVNGTLKPNDRIRFMGTGVETQVKEVGLFSPQPVPLSALAPGMVGYVVGTVREPSDVRVGDTVTLCDRPATRALSGFKDVRSMVFAGLYPVSAEDYDKCRQSIEKLALNDASFTFHPESSVALGFGFRCGFLGLLHMEIVQERLRREFDLDIISTHPAVIYKVVMRSGEVREIDNPVHLPDPTQYQRIEEPLIRAVVICRNEHIGDIMRLVMDRRGEVIDTESLDHQRVLLTCTLPLNEILVDFHDQLKSVTRGYSSMDYEYAGYQTSDIVRLDILLNGDPVDAFSNLVHRSKAVSRGRQICKALKETIPPHMFAVPVQAVINKSVVARETIRAFRKDVTAKLYGGDVTRKQKVLKRQKEGKKRMKQFGSVNVPQKSFISVLKTS